ncbi:LysR family transcriptional regulator ArgP [Rodentibacter caecimuris]|uniref:Transcriptional regulator ArgP n=1 Tax=Rodentibacter caecimuris TaxID=1796644 RepID=A0ABX3KXT8_9PAST|nr:transcriptional regulator ArgP [Rodentibacter heylii]
MQKIDYKSLRLLDLIIKEQGFEKASNKLNITQSAVSQRIKLLENEFGELLVTRTNPPKPTELGKKLLKLLYHVNLLEHDIFDNGGVNIESIPISINADSLATWFLPAVQEILTEPTLRLNIQIEDETKTLDSLISGDVIAAISTYPKPIINGKCDYIGSLDYILASSPQFAEQYFPSGVNKEALLKAPIATFSRSSDLHHIFLQEHFGISPGNLISHIVPSSEAYIQLILQHSACCMISKQQIRNELETGKIINLLPNLVQQKKLYWHRYNLESESIKKLSLCIKEKGTKLLQE